MITLTCTAQGKRLLRQGGVLLLKTQLQSGGQPGISSYSAGSRPRGNYVERHTYGADMLEVGDCIKMYVINYSLGSWRKSLDKETRIAKEILPKR